MAVRPRVLGARPKVERDREYEARRRQSKPWRQWYALPVWQAIRRAVLDDRPLCERCEREERVVAATVVNHCTPHRGVWELFIAGPFEALCKHCHDSAVQREERGEARRIAAGGRAGRKSGA